MATGLNEDPPSPLPPQLISQESSPGVRYEYYLPLSTPRPSFSWSHGSWSDCSAECGKGEGPGEGAVLSSSSNSPGQVDICRSRRSPWGNSGVGGLHKGPLPKLGEPERASPRAWHLIGEGALWAVDAEPEADDRLSKRGLVTHIKL